MNGLDCALLPHWRFGPMLGISAAIGAGGAILGVYASFWLDSAPAPTIVLILTAMFLAALGWRQVRVRRLSR